jgi:hypothetical protein
VLGILNPGLPLPLESHLKITALDFTRTEGHRTLPALRQLWVEGLTPRDRAFGEVHLGVPRDAVFHLKSVRPSADWMECDMAGRPATLKVGKTGPGQELVPSVLEDLLRPLCKPIGLC